MLSRSHAVWSLGACCLALLAGCSSGTSKTEQAVEARTLELLRALEGHGETAPSDFFDAQIRAKIPGLDSAALGPLTIRHAAVRLVEPAAKESTEVWTVHYHAEIGDLPGTLFNFLADKRNRRDRDTLRRYEVAIVQAGTLTWKEVDGTWLISQAPSEDEPVGLACKLADLDRHWLDDAASPVADAASSPGKTAATEPAKDADPAKVTDPASNQGSTTAAHASTPAKPGQDDLRDDALGATLLPRLFTLADQAIGSTHAKGASRAALLRQLAQRLRLAEEVGPATVLDSRFLPRQDESLADAVEALASLDQLLGAWWRGQIERKSNLLVTADGKPWEQSSDLAATSQGPLRNSPVRLASYAVTSLEPSPISVDAYVVSVDCRLTAPSSVFAMVRQSRLMGDPRADVVAIEETMQAPCRFVVRRSADQWHVVMDEYRGALAYLLRSGRAVLAGRAASLSVDDLLSSFDYFYGLDFAPYGKSIADVNFRAAVEERVNQLVQAIVKQFPALTGESDMEVAIDKLAFSVGNEIAFVHQLRLTGSAQLPSGSRSVQDQTLLRDDLQTKIVSAFRILAPDDWVLAQGNAVLAEPPIDNPLAALQASAYPLRDAVALRHTSWRGSVCAVGYMAGALRLGTLLRDSQSESVRAQANAWSQAIRTSLADELDRMYGGTLRVKYDATTFLRDPSTSDTVLADDAVRQLQDFNWFFERSPDLTTLDPSTTIPSVELPTAEETARIQRRAAFELGNVLVHLHALSDVDEALSSFYWQDEARSKLLQLNVSLIDDLLANIVSDSSSEEFTTLAYSTIRTAVEAQSLESARILDLGYHASMAEWASRMHARDDEFQKLRARGWWSQAMHGLVQTLVGLQEGVQPGTTLRIYELERLEEPPTHDLVADLIFSTTFFRDD